jgi:hypothetical protein
MRQSRLRCKTPFASPPNGCLPSQCTGVDLPLPAHYDHSPTLRLTADAAFERPPFSGAATGLDFPENRVVCGQKVLVCSIPRTAVHPAVLRRPAGPIRSLALDPTEQPYE